MYSGVLSLSGWLSTNTNTHVIELANSIAAALMTTLIGYFIHVNILF